MKKGKYLSRLSQLQSLFPFLGKGILFYTYLKGKYRIVSKKVDVYNRFLRPGDIITALTRRFIYEIKDSISFSREMKEKILNSISLFPSNLPF